MKFSYSLLKKLAPKIPAVSKVVDGLNMHAFEVDAVSGDVLDIKLYANRYSDASSHAGMARELSAIFNLPFKNPVKTLVNFPTGKGLAKVKVEEKDLCPRYSARYFELNKVGQSPSWLKNILKSCGVQSINSVVDIMNYAMLVTGQPLHAFDAEKLNGGIVVRRARKDEAMTTLDNRHLILNPETLVIADAKKALAIAGIKGGLHAGVTANTRKIIVEGANFDATSIFKSSRTLKLQTDASIRFAHNLSPALVAIGLDCATELLKAEGAKLKDSADIYPKKVTEEVITFEPAKYMKLIGAEVRPADIKKYFTALGFEVSGKKVRIPAWRRDVENFEDLSEELARFMGYGRLKGEPPMVSIRPPEESDEFSFSEKAKELLVRSGLDEVYNSSFYGEAEDMNFKESFFGADAVPVELENPIADDKKFLRKNLSALLIKNSGENSRYFDSIKIFEIGKTFALVSGKTEEKLVLGMCFAGKKYRQGALELKGAIDELLRRFGVTEFYFEEKGGLMFVMIEGRQLGYIKVLGSVQGAKQWIAAAGELDAEELIKIISETHEYKPLSKYPEMMRDISIVLDGSVRIGDVVQDISEANSSLIENVDLLDEYTDEKFGHRQSLTFRIVFMSDEKTLSDEEVNLEMQKIVEILKKNYNAEIR